MDYLIGYARVSTVDQNPQLQLDALERAGCDRVVTERASGMHTDRPVLAAVLGDLRRGTRWWCGGWTVWVGRCGI